MQERRKKIERMVEQMFGLVDADQSGSVSIEEMSQALGDNDVLEMLRQQLKKVGVAEESDVANFKLGL
eukprot:CAMPEP_0115366418 /NCGR_PEP_ID=MMETSP0270-20121206/104799_1 /TAXON_ID=71861 /ORGANISM="Scrippsiella trochoidea, Strain CCMP3099" /LENGTH=67 /DNA_ID=CAMNT_0002789197 /DNA_START=36 /DNA_END=235 /DNA_ORIENTATION=-